MKHLHTLLLSCASLTGQAAEPGAFDARAAIDAYMDTRDEPSMERFAATTAALVGKLEGAGLDVAAVEQVLRGPRKAWSTPEGVTPGKLGTKLFSLTCEHVDYKTTYFLYLPKGYDPGKRAPLLVVAHGGNGAMLIRRAAGAAFVGMRVWTRVADERGYILAAPITQRGWGNIGNSVVFSLLSKLQRTYDIDPDRIYVTGHSMGGHMTWRTALNFADRFAAFAPMSGGYDFVKTSAIDNLFNTAGYATYCEREPYGIDKDNATNAAFLKEKGFDWVSVQRPGSHTIPMDDLPKIVEFFAARPRDMYPKVVFLRRGGRMSVDTAPDAEASKQRNWPRTEGWEGPHTWKKTRPIDLARSYWVRLVPREPEAGDKPIVQTVLAKNAGDNRLELTTDQVRHLVLYLHPKMVDFARPVTVVANGETVFEGKVEPSLTVLLDAARWYDDRGRLFHARVDVKIGTDREVPVPRR